MAEAGLLKLTTEIAIFRNNLMEVLKDMPHNKHKRQRLLVERIHTQPVSTISGLNGHSLMKTDGGYQAYVALWYQVMAAQQQGGQPQDGPTQPPGTS